MPMFKKNLKLIATAIGLVTVLVMGLAMPGATQQDALTRENLIQLINRVYAPTLTASEGIIWDTQCVSFYSSPFITFSFIPANPYSRSIERIRSGDFDNVPLFILYVHDDGGSKPTVKRQILPGAYMAKLVSPTKVVFVDQEGNEVLTGSAEITISDRPSTSYFPCFPGQIQAGFTLGQPSSQAVDLESPLQTSSDGYICGYVEYCYAWCFIRVIVKVVIACTVEEGLSNAQAKDIGDRLYALNRLRH
jgi:hypothetical protein